MNDSLLYLWGKTVKGHKDQYHPLLFHLLDVGHCAQLLWKQCLPSVMKERLANALRLDENNARRAVVLLAALHDLGKATPGFQLQPSAPIFLREPLESAGRASLNNDNKPHSLISTYELDAWIKSGDWIWTAPAQTAKILAHCVGAHHGTFPIVDDYPFVDSVLGNEAWKRARRDLAAAVINLLDEGEPIISSEIEDASAVAILSGLLAVADWLGSSQFFPAAGREHLPNGAPDAERYNIISRRRAARALREFGWLPGVQFAETPLDFKQFFKFAPNDLQSAVIEKTNNLTGPFLVIAEAPMGVGKTEAGFAAIDAALTQRQANGFYIALPTQATGNAMHDRVRDDYLGKGRHKGNLNLQLVHSGALLKENLHKENLQIQNGAIYDETSDRPTVAAQSWFTQRKQALLAPFGAGTIDQSLTGVLQTKHWFVRLFGLAGKVVVFDEVHAYDTYMSELLIHLLKWLRALDCSVVLLSATLPSSKRHQLLRAWDAEVPEPEAHYPRLTWVSAGQPFSLPLENTAQKKEIALRYLPRSVGQLADELRQKLSDGGSACVICNTVDRAQKVFAALQNELGCDFCDEWCLFHARFPYQWRQDRETDILKFFGKKKANRPHRAIVVATQVIEQSLDLDFDWMVTELAPIDLLLQRAGRLHRHAFDENQQEIKRPQPVENPELVILCDVEDNGLPQIKDWEAIYEPFILLRSWLALQGRNKLSLPPDIETLIEQVYEVENTAPGAIWQKALEDALDTFEENARNAKAQSKNVRVAPPEHPNTVCSGQSRNLLDDDDPNTHYTLKAATRLGDPSIQCVCLIRTTDGLFLPDKKGNADLNWPVPDNPDRDAARRLMRHSVPISSKRLFFTLRAQKVPNGWQDNAHLRFARALEFENGRCVVGGHTLRLDRELGLVIENGGDGK